MEPEQIVELENSFIVLAVPSDTVEVEITATVYMDGKLQKVKRTMGFGEVREAMKEAEDGYIPSDAVFTLAPMGEEKITEIVRKYKERMNED